MKTKAVIFDMDGVISDTQIIHSTIESDLLKKYGVALNPKDITRKYAGTRMREWMPRVFKNCNIEPPPIDTITAEKSRHLEVALSDNILEVPGVRNFIEFLKRENILIAVASASRLSLIDRILSKLNLKKEFDAIASSEEVKIGKPAPDIFLLAAERLSVSPRDCMVIEDGVSGMIGAKKAGMRCVALSRDGHRDYPADFIVTNFREIIIRKIL